jgi:hypothetical protein
VRELEGALVVASQVRRERLADEFELSPIPDR